MSRLCLPLALVLTVVVSPARADDDTPAAAKTRQLLKTKITVEFKDTRLEDCLDEIKEMVKGLKIVVTGEEALDERWGNTPVITIQKIQVLE